MHIAPDEPIGEEAEVDEVDDGETKTGGETEENVIEEEHTEL